MKIFYRSCFFLSLAIISFFAPAQNKWQLSKDNNNIKIFTRKTDSSDFKSVKVEALLTGTCDKLAGILLGIEKQIKWVYKTKSLHLIKRFSQNELIYYAETSLPWPMRNRDQAIHIIIYPDSANQSIKIITKGEPNAIPVTNGIVRVPYFLGVWQVKTISPGKIFIEYYLDVDPGGSVPAWMSNMFVAKGPYETFMNLAELLRK